MIGFIIMVAVIYIVLSLFEEKEDEWKEVYFENGDNIFEKN